MCERLPREKIVFTEKLLRKNKETSFIQKDFRLYSSE
jgi:hypothetical protein